MITLQKSPTGYYVKSDTETIGHVQSADFEISGKCWWAKYSPSWTNVYCDARFSTRKAAVKWIENAFNNKFNPEDAVDLEDGTVDWIV